MPLFQVILSTSAGAVFDVELRAADACTAAGVVGDGGERTRPARRGD